MGSRAYSVISGAKVISGAAWGLGYLVVHVLGDGWCGQSLQCVWEVLLVGFVF